MPRYGNETPPTPKAHKCINVSYKRSILATCFSHSYGHPQESVLKEWKYREFTDFCEPMYRYKALSLNRTEFWLTKVFNISIQSSFVMPSLRMATRMAETCNRNSMCVHVCVFVGLVTITNCSVHGLGLFKKMPGFTES